jgi:hypothetical protein
MSSYFFQANTNMSWIDPTQEKKGSLADIPVSML